jgi:hypothetical protein
MSKEYLTEEKMSAEDLMRITLEQRERIESIRFIPPTLGSDSFGYFKVTMKYGRAGQIIRTKQIGSKAQ